MNEILSQIQIKREDGAIFHPSTAFKWGSTQVCATWIDGPWGEETDLIAISFLILLMKVLAVPCILSTVETIRVTRADIKRHNSKISLKTAEGEG